MAFPWHFPPTFNPRESRSGDLSIVIIMIKPKQPGNHAPLMSLKVTLSACGRREMLGRVIQVIISPAMIATEVFRNTVSY